MIRPIVPFDRPIIDEWISRDPDHSAKGMTAQFFIDDALSGFAVTSQDETVMFVRVDFQGNTAKMHIQFDEGKPLRTARALIDNFPYVVKMLEAVGAHDLIFDSMSPKLTHFCVKYLGFSRVGDTNDYARAI